MNTGLGWIQGRIRVRYNGSDTIALRHKMIERSVDHQSLEIETEWELDEGDYVELQIYHTEAGAVDLAQEDYYSPVFYMHWVRPPTGTGS
jgi:hypothetical protein